MFVIYNMTGMFKKPYIVFFFVSLFALLFMGDGKQMITDTMGIIVAVGTLAIAASLSTKQRHLPGILMYPWCLFFSALFISAATSIDLGDSLYSIVRTVAAALTFYVFFVYSDSKDTQYYSCALLIFGMASLCTAILFTALLPKDAALPRMNLVTTAYGHNHIIDILFFVIPLSLVLYLHQKKKKHAAIAGFALLGVLFSLSRVGIFLAGALVMVISLSTKRMRKISLPISILLIILATAAIIWGGYGSYVPDALKPQYNKGAYGSDGRIEYWRQALVSFLEKPLLGSGPGTFYLTSKRLQENPQANSWYAHNVILETMSETGIAGTAGLVLVIISVFYHYFKHKVAASIYSHGLAWSLAAVFVLGLTDYVFNFYLIQLLWWATAGVVLASVSKNKNTENGQPATFYFPVIFLGFFYVVTMFDLVADSFTDNKRMLFFLAPQVRYKAEGYLEDLEDKKNEPDRTALSLLEFFHKENAPIIFSTARTLEAAGQNEKADEYYSKGLRFDPKNESERQKYMDLLTKTGSHSKISEQMTHHMYMYMLPEHKQAVDKALPFTEEEIQIFDSKIFSLLFDSRHIHEIRFARAFYVAGLLHIKDDPGRTEVLWKAANTLQPGLSDYYIELASLYHSLHKEDKAEEALESCFRNEFAREACRAVSVTTLPPPGSLAQINEKRLEQQ